VPGAHIEYGSTFVFIVTAGRFCLQRYTYAVRITLILFHVHSFLCNPAKDVDLRKWAAEGLAYLTLDAEVKEDLVEDTDALRSVIDLAKVFTSFMSSLDKTAFILLHV